MAISFSVESIVTSSLEYKNWFNRARIVETVVTAILLAFVAYCAARQVMIPAVASYVMMGYCIVSLSIEVVRRICSKSEAFVELPAKDNREIMSALPQDESLVAVIEIGEGEEQDIALSKEELTSSMSEVSEVAEVIRPELLEKFDNVEVVREKLFQVLHARTADHALASHLLLSYFHILRPDIFTDLRIMELKKNERFAYQTLLQGSLYMYDQNEKNVVSSFIEALRSELDICMNIGHYVFATPQHGHHLLETVMILGEPFLRNPSEETLIKPENERSLQVREQFLVSCKAKPSQKAHATELLLDYLELRLPRIFLPSVVDRLKREKPEFARTLLIEYRKSSLFLTVKIRHQVHINAIREVLQELRKELQIRVRENNKEEVTLRLFKDKPNPEHVVRVLGRLVVKEGISADMEPYPSE